MRKGAPQIDHNSIKVDDEANQYIATTPSLHSLDIIISNTGEYFIGEIGGVCSGMKGFVEVYGDNRVEEEVYDRLSEFGELTVNIGKYHTIKREEYRKEYRKEHPVKYFFKNDYEQFQKKFRSRFRKILSKKEKEEMDKSNFKRYLKQKGIPSEKLDIDWMYEDIPNIQLLSGPFEDYVGQESLVLNYQNDPLLHPTVTHYVEEEITRSKFLQYLLLLDSPIIKYFPETTLVGLGTADEDCLEKMIEKHSTFIKKPEYGKCGCGVKVVGRNTLREYIKEKGPMKTPTFFDNLTKLFLKKQPEYVRDLVLKKNYSFKWGTQVIQPFINSKGSISKDQFSSVRAIICNGKFVDAYARVSKHPRVNKSQDAKAIAFKESDLGDFCEKVIREFRSKVHSVPFEFEQSLYLPWFNRVTPSNINPIIIELVNSDIVMIDLK